MLTRSRLLFTAIVVAASGCASTHHAASTPTEDSSMDNDATAQPPPEIQAWMDRLTVDHEYDPETGFIVAREVIGLPPVIADGPPVSAAVRQSAESGRLVIVFATADRCAPCQQYKQSALNDPRVVERLSQPGIIASHVEVDRKPDEARQTLGSLAIPMTYAFQGGERIATLRGQRSADELLAWLEGLGAQ